MHVGRAAAVVVRLVEGQGFGGVLGHVDVGQLLQQTLVQFQDFLAARFPVSKDLLDRFFRVVIIIKILVQPHTHLADELGLEHLERGRGKKIVILEKWQEHFLLVMQDTARPG